MIEEVIKIVPLVVPGIWVGLIWWQWVRNPTDTEDEFIV